MTEQNQRAFQKQKGVFVSDKRRVLGRWVKGKSRLVKKIGLDFKTPKEAIEGTYIDKKCPFTGNVSIRGRILRGVVISTKMERTIIIRRDYLHYLKKYNRFEKRHRNLPAHCSPCFKHVKPGDIVTIGQTRPLSKTVHFNVIKWEPQQGVDAVKQFRQF
ncbi:40S ribosomal protein S11 [Anaeramoeba flamelloides]|uniref:40S ribosomal protein S11 n=1 Tax=Anaeramoeba flamelloides TaxID=1746091 RepID=A0ABQ8YZ63_9EUKA|nr:40S ribosomal protein S11 [Anaeramoeba flamelloides]